MRRLYFVLLLLTAASTAYAQTDTTVAVVAPASPAKKAWYESFNIRGYVQARYNTLQTNPDLECEQCDNSWGGDGGFFLRRIRVIFSGQISPRVYFYIQPDFASAVSSSSLHYGQLRDAYFDVGIDKENRFRIRIGQSKIPYGFENLQSSSNRLPLDRADPLNSALRNERDLGVIFYWAPSHIRKRLSDINKQGLKGSGDYGVFGLAVYNGQTANRPELNENRHIAARLSYPFAIGKQIIEPGVQAYTGKYVVYEGQTTKNVIVNADRNYIDERVAASFVLYPQPFGIQAEYNIGRGPEFNKETDAIEVQSLHGGYATLSYLAKIGDHTLIPFTRMQYYKGGKKHEQDARSYKMQELELGVEWEPVDAFELVVMYTFSKRRFEDFGKQDNLQEGRLLRMQAQLNF